MASQKPITKPRENSTVIPEGDFCNPTELQIGDKLSTTMYYSYIGPVEVDYNNPNPCSMLTNEADGATYLIDNSVIAKNFHSTQYTEEKKLC